MNKSRWCQHLRWLRAIGDSPVKERKPKWTTPTWFHFFLHSICQIKLLGICSRFIVQGIVCQYKPTWRNSQRPLWSFYHRNEGYESLHWEHKDESFSLPQNEEGPRCRITGSVLLKPSISRMISPFKHGYLCNACWSLRLSRTLKRDKILVKWLLLVMRREKFTTCTSSLLNGNVCVVVSMSRVTSFSKPKSIN